MIARCGCWVEARAGCHLPALAPFLKASIVLPSLPLNPHFLHFSYLPRVLQAFKREGSEDELMAMGGRRGTKAKDKGKAPAVAEIVYEDGMVGGARAARVCCQLMPITAFCIGSLPVEPHQLHHSHSTQPKCFHPGCPCVCSPARRKGGGLSSCWVAACRWRSSGASRLYSCRCAPKRVRLAICSVACCWWC